MKRIDKFIRILTQYSAMTRRDVLKLAGSAGIMTVLPLSSMRPSYASPTHSQRSVKHPLSNDYPDWIAEARIGGLTVSGVKVNPTQLQYDLGRLIKQGVTVIEADSRLSDYLSEKDFTIELQRIKATTEIIHQHDLKVVWYIPSLEVLTPNGVSRKDSFARTHPDWVQLTFDGENRATFYGRKVFWVHPKDESAWLCPNSPYRDWFKSHLRRLAETGVDGIWLDVPIFDQIIVKWSCSCHYCREKFTHQTGMEFPRRFDVRDKAFWRFVRWRHETITEFLDDCKETIQSVNPDTVTIAEIVTLDHMGATLLGAEGSAMPNILIVWEVDAVSETTAMAEASYDDWMAMHNIFKYCRGATMDRPSWVFCYGYDESDAQLVIASAIAAQNNPYELRTPQMTSTVGMEFRQMMFNWIAQYSKQIFRSRSIAPVAVIYSERNRDFLDTVHAGGIYLSPAPPLRDRKWLGKKSESPINLEYMGDYRGLSILLYQNQIPTDIYPISRVNEDLLSNYPVLILPYMASISEAEKKMLLEAVKNGSNLIITGPEPGMWDAGGTRREESLWSEINPNLETKKSSVSLGKGKVYFWKERVGQQYLKSHDDDITEHLLTWLKECGVNAWISEKLPVVIQPYVYDKQVIIHVLNYSWIGGLANQPKRLELKLSVPWGHGHEVIRVIQSEPQWSKPKTLDHSEKGGRVVIPLEVGINALIIVETT
jgi:hypothetical protein